MNKKTCPRCRKDFECKSDDIVNCQCACIELQPRQREYIATQYQACLCKGCLQQLSEEVVFNS